MTTPLVIPSLGRPNYQPTFDILPDRWKERTFYALAHEDLAGYGRADARRVLMQPKPYRLHTTRQHIVDSLLGAGHKKLIMADDDQIFSVRHPEYRVGNKKYVPATSEQVGWGLDLLDRALDNFAMVGFSHRAWAVCKPVESVWLFNQKLTAVVGVRLDVLKEESIKYADAPIIWSDYHVCLSLLRRGWPNAFLCQIQTNSKMNTPGGVSGYRKKVMNKSTVNKFMALHGDYTRVRIKKASWGDGMTEEVLDITPLFRKCWNMGLEEYGEQKL